IAGAQYNPFTLILHDDPNVPNYSLNNTHEVIHWYQHHGTTVGAFLSALRHSQNRTIINLFSQLTPAQKQEILNRRNGGKPLLLIDKSGKLIHQNINELSDLFIQIWYDHQILLTLFDDSQALESVGFPLSQILAEICGDIVLFTLDHLGTEDYPGNEIARSWYNLAIDAPIFIALPDDTRLTTRSIIEGQAVANNYLSFKHDVMTMTAATDDFGGVKIEQIERELKEGINSSPFQVFLQIINDDSQSLRDLIPTFNLACDLALNPALPPIVMSEVPEGKSRTWKDIYPPLRFIAICQAFTTIPLLTSEPDHSELQEKIRDICELNMWESPLEFVHPYKRSIHQRDYAKDSTTLDDPEETTFLYDYILWVQNQMWDARQTALPVFVNRAMLSLGELARKYVEFVVTTWETDARWKRPLNVSRQDKMWHNDKGNTFGTKILINVAFENALYDFVSDAGDFDMSIYPTSVSSNPYFVQPIYKFVGDALDIKIPYTGMRFRTERVLITKMIQQYIKDGLVTEEMIDDFVKKHLYGDFGQAHKDMELENNSVIEAGFGLIYSIFMANDLKIYVVTTMSKDETFTVISTLSEL
ncbi:MAG: hypothetical protein AAFR81_29375, partial [Chloroflexota bacterium]